MAATSDKIIKFEFDDANTLPVAASTKIYKHTAIGNNGSGYARPLVAGDPFLGFSESQIDNSSGSAGDKKVNLRRQGRAPLAVTGVTGVGDIGSSVYASDDSTYTKTATGNTYIGKIIRWETGTRCVVLFGAQQQASSVAIVPLTDNSTGTASDTIASISDTATKNAIASLTAKVNLLIAKIQ
jgi:hypothetical protein